MSLLKFLGFSLSEIDAVIQSNDSEEAEESAADFIAEALTNDHWPVANDASIIYTTSAEPLPGLSCGQRSVTTAVKQLSAQTNRSRYRTTRPVTMQHQRFLTSIEADYRDRRNTHSCVLCIAGACLT